MCFTAPCEGHQGLKYSVSSSSRYILFSAPSDVCHVVPHLQTEDVQKATNPQHVEH